MKSKDDWLPGHKDIDLLGTPFLVLGLRKGQKGMEAYRVDLHQETHEDLRQVCVSVLTRIAETDPRPYEPNAGLEVDEHFSLTVDELPKISKEAANTEEDDENPERTAALIEVLRNPSALDLLPAVQLDTVKPIYYSIAWQQVSDDWAHFIRKTNPRQYFKPGRKWFQYADILKKIESPSLAIDSTVDVIFYKKNLWGFSDTYLRQLFTDVHLTMKNVPQYVINIEKVLKEIIPLLPAAAEALERVAKRRTSFARRLYDLPNRLNSIDRNLLTPEAIRTRLQEEGIETHLIISDDGKFDFDDDYAGHFLDIIEPRYYTDGLTGEKLRADKYSTRPEIPKQ